ncbi:MAG: carboxypeptidase regulatory-like domain-containing protein [Gemmatimonadaceae bacterium]
MIRSDGAPGVSWARLAAPAVAAGLAVALGRGARAQIPVRTDSTGTIAGLVIIKDSGVPLPYSVVAIPSLNRERFTSDQGAFTLSDLPVGPIVVRVRHIGYSPADIAVNVRAGMTDTVRVSLSHIAVRLSAMEVHATVECKNPGVPHDAKDSAFAVVFDQLKLNADQYRLLTEAYPFRYWAERRTMHTQADGEARIDRVDTVVIDSRTPWRYKPGGVLSLGDGPPGFRPTELNIPTLVHFADQVFVDNHCFTNGGSETIEGVDLLRIDFTAASRIRDPDVNGSMYLDPSTFQIKRSVIRLSRIPRNMPSLRAVEATTWFTNQLGSISMIAGISSANRMRVPGDKPTAISAWLEDQQLIRVQFLRGMPGEDVKKP